MFKRLLAILCVLVSQHVYAQAVGDTIHIYFERNVDKLNARSEALLDSLTNLGIITVKDNLYIIGYADYLGNEEHNQVLSDTRARSVAAYLANFGVNSDNIKVCLGKGQVERVVQKNPDGFPGDRRVDIVVIEKYVPDNDPPPVKRMVPGKTAKKTGRILVNDDTDPNRLKKKIKANNREETSRILEDDPANLNIVVKPGSPKHIPDDFKMPDKGKKTMSDISKYKAGETIVLDNIYFYPESHMVREQSAGELQELYNMLRANPRLKIRIEGHVCCVTDVDDAFDIDSQDNHLSVNRAKYIYDFLIKKGISEERLKYIGFGRSKPVVAAELTEADANKNRRVEIRILEK